MKMENNTQKEQSNPLFGLFDLVHLLLNNIKILVIFFLITLLINSFLFYKYDYNSNNSVEPDPDSSEYVLTAQVFAKSSIETSSIELLNEQLIEMQTMLINLQRMLIQNNIEFENQLDITVKPNLKIFNSDYLLRYFFDMLTNPSIIHEVLISLGINDNNTNQDSINSLTSYYVNNIHKKFMNPVSIENPTTINIKLNTTDFDLDKKIIENLIIASNHKVREAFINNINIMVKTLSLISQNIMQGLLNEKKHQKTLEQKIQEHRDLILLKSHYKTALNLNLQKPQILTSGAYSNFSSPLFYQLGTEHLSEMIMSLENKIENILKLELTTKDNELDAVINILTSNTQFIEENIKNIIEMSKINNIDELFLIYFTPSSITIDPLVINTGVTRPGTKLYFAENYILYILIFLIGIFIFIGFVLISENYKKYKSN